MSQPSPGRKVLEQAVYVVMVRVHQRTPDAPNTEIVTIKLRRRDADKVVSQVPGAWIERVVASKP